LKIRNREKPLKKHCESQRIKFWSFIRMYRGKDEQDIISHTKEQQVIGGKS
jgi:hypothetical protein